MEVCWYCIQDFSTDEWDDRHTHSSGEDVHEECCDICHGDDMGHRRLREAEPMMGDKNHVLDLLNTRLEQVIERLTSRTESIDLRKASLAALYLEIDEYKDEKDDLERVIALIERDN